MSIRIWGFTRVAVGGGPATGLGPAARLTLTLAAIAAALTLAAPAAARTTAAGTATGSLRLALPLRADEAGLEQFATAVSTPGSPLYGQYESVATLSRRFGAPAAERARVVGFLRGAGATHVRIDATGLFADATMSAATARRTFATALRTLRSARSTRFVAPASAITIPPGLRGAVTGVVGLDTRPLAVTPQLQTRERSSVTTDAVSGYQSRTGTATGCGAATAQTGFTPNQYLTAYDYQALHDANLSGQGERVALIEIDGFRESDLRAFAGCFGLPIPKTKGFLVGLTHPLPAGGESTLDLEVLDAAAPRLKEIDVYESGPTAIDVLSSLTAPLNNPGYRPDVISASLGACEPATLEAIGDAGLRAAEGALATAAASGISVLSSSGDDGSSACVGPDGKPLPETAVSYPASSPWVTGIGGTNFMLNPDNTIASQDVWNDSPIVVAASGGGSSTLFARPYYQSGFQLSDKRGVPDVSLLSDIAPGYEIYCTVKGPCVNAQTSGPWTQVGGTSAAAPLFAGGLALVDQDLRMEGRQDLGLVNPLLYSIERLPTASAVISPVAVGSNDLGSQIDGSPLGCCTAGPGYNLASGLGSVNMAALAFAASAMVPKIVSVALSVPSQHRPVASGHLVARVSCTGRCLAGAYVRITIGSSQRAITDYSSVYLIRSAGAKTVKIAFAKNDLLRLRAAVAGHQRIVATIYGAIVDPSGTVESATGGQTIKLSS